jgi:hypothetical protein
LASLYENGVSGILADEMGLGAFIYMCERESFIVNVVDDYDDDTVAFGF